jgi:hypothetical protein
VKLAVSWPPAWCVPCLHFPEMARSLRSPHLRCEGRGACLRAHWVGLLLGETSPTAQPQAQQEIRGGRWSDGHPFAWPVMPQPLAALQHFLPLHHPWPHCRPHHFHLWPRRLQARFQTHIWQLSAGRSSWSPVPSCRHAWHNRGRWEIWQDQEPEFQVRLECGWTCFPYTKGERQGRNSCRARKFSPAHGFFDKTQQSWRKEGIPLHQKCLN